LKPLKSQVKSMAEEQLYIDTGLSSSVDGRALLDFNTGLSVNKSTVFS